MKKKIIHIHKILGLLLDRPRKKTLVEYWIKRHDRWQNQMWHPGILLLNASPVTLRTTNRFRFLFLKKSVQFGFSASCISLFSLWITKIFSLLRFQSLLLSDLTAYSTKPSKRGWNSNLLGNNLSKTETFWSYWIN